MVSQDGGKDRLYNNQGYSPNDWKIGLLDFVDPPKLVTFFLFGQFCCKTVKLNIKLYLVAATGELIQLSNIDGVINEK